MRFNAILKKGVLMTQVAIEQKTVKGVFTIKNDRGLHTRPSTEIVKCATSFNAHIQLSYRQMVVNAKSILGILMLAACKGSRIRVTASGEDAEQAVDALVQLSKNQFNIQY